MHKRILGLAVAVAALMGVAHAENKKVTIGVSIPAADHGWTAGVVLAYWKRPVSQTNAV